MSGNMKFIRYHGEGVDEMVIFSELQNHNDIARNLGISSKIISAGFVDIGHDGFEYIVFKGKSTTLGIGSIPNEDKEHLCRQFRQY